VDLLKREEMGSQKAKEYIGILEEKSARLKVLMRIWWRQARRPAESGSQF